MFVYDKVSRLVEGSINGGTGPGESGGLQELDYDAYGNILEMRVSDALGSEVRTFGLSASHNRFLDDWEVEDGRCRETAYDDGDNLIRWSQQQHCFQSPPWEWTNEYSYDQLNMMVEHWQGNNPFGDPPVKHHETYLVYTADDERIARIEVGSASAETFWTVRDLEGKVLRTAKETGGSWLWLRDYVWRNGQMLASVEPGSPQEVVYHYHVDHLGNPRVVTTTGRAFVRAHDFYPLGEELVEGALTDPLRFTGHERDVDGMGGEGEGGDLDYMHARYYSAGIGRFLSLDPVASAVLANPQSWNKYTYALNNPLKWVDPNGETVESALGQISEFAAAIEFASGITGGRVTPVEIARVVFQENRNDFNLRRGYDSSAVPFMGGPELKNLRSFLLFAVGGLHGSFGIVEMRTDTAAQLLGWDPDNLSAELQDRIQRMLSNPIDSLILAALYLDQLKEQNPGASTEEILNAYNTGSTVINDDNSKVYARSGAYLHEIEESLDKGPNEGGKLRVVRCGGGYRFENQCPQ